MTKHRPLLLLTRPEGSARQFLEQLDEGIINQVDVVISPLITIVPSENVPDLNGYKGLIFTSTNGVTSAACMLDNRDQIAYCVGSATTEAARRWGWKAIQAGRTADELVASLIDTKPEAPLIHLRGMHTRGSVASRLSESGVQTSEHVAYDQIAQPMSDEARAAMNVDRIVIAPLFSPRSAEFFSRQAPRCSIVIAALSAAVAQNTASIEDAIVHVAQTPDAQAIGRLVEKLLRAAVSG